MHIRLCIEIECSLELRVAQHALHGLRILTPFVDKPIGKTVTEL